MNKQFMLIVPLLFALVLSGALAQSGDTTVSTMDDPELGTYLTDAEGMTLYLFTKDEPGSGKSVCNDQCAENWPPFTLEDPLTLPEGVPGELTQITRDDGTQQVAYNGWPLYSWVDDMEPGDATGQGVGDVWYVVAPPEPGATPMASPVASPVTSPVASRRDKLHTMPVEQSNCQVGPIARMGVGSRWSPIISIGRRRTSRR